MRSTVESNDRSARMPATDLDAPTEDAARTVRLSGAGRSGQIANGSEDE
jgi:hypothetical protein